MKSNSSSSHFRSCRVVKMIILVDHHLVTQALWLLGVRLFSGLSYSIYVVYFLLFSKNKRIYTYLKKFCQKKKKHPACVTGFDISEELAFNFSIHFKTFWPLSPISLTLHASPLAMTNLFSISLSLVLFVCLDSFIRKITWCLSFSFVVVVFCNPIFNNRPLY